MKYVKINKDRGYGNGIFKVIAETNNEYSLKSIDSGVQISIYKALCHTDSETIRFQIEQAKKIGKNKK